MIGEEGWCSSSVEWEHIRIDANSVCIEEPIPPGTIQTSFIRATSAPMLNPKVDMNMRLLLNHHQLRDADHLLQSSGTRIVCTGLTGSLLFGLVGLV